jgi:hypothetical protein
MWAGTIQSAGSLDGIKKGEKKISALSLKLRHPLPLAFGHQNSKLSSLWTIGLISVGFSGC